MDDNFSGVLVFDILLMFGQQQFSIFNSQIKG